MAAFFRAAVVVERWTCSEATPLATMQEVLMVTANVKVIFAREFQVDNRRLRKTRVALEELTRNPAASENHRLEIVRLLAELRDQLAIHFALEEACGYFEEIREMAPHLVAQAETLKAEHEDLFESIRRVADEAEKQVTRSTPANGRLSANRRESGRNGQALARIVRRFQIFDKRLTAHEARDSALMLDAFDTDIGGGD